MIHPSSSEDEESDVESPKEVANVVAVKEASAAIARKNSVRSQAKTDSSASIPESSHSSIRLPSPSSSSVSDEAEVKARLQEETDHYQRLQLYVFVVRCIACPFTAKQPNDLPKRDLQVKKGRLESIKSRFENFLSGKSQSKSDELFSAALSTFYKNFLNNHCLDSLVLGGGCSMDDLREVFKQDLVKQLKRLLEIDGLSRDAFVTSSMKRFDTLARDCDDDIRRYDKPSPGSFESVSTKEQLYDLYQSVLGIKKSEHQLVLNASQLDNMDEQVAAIRRELRGRIKAADKIEMQCRFPEFLYHPGQTEPKIKRQYLNELRLQVNNLMGALEGVPLSAKLNNGKSAPKLRLLPSFPSSDHSAEEEMTLSKSDVVLQFPYEIVVVEVQGLQSIPPNRLVYCTMEVGGSKEKLQTDLVPVSKPVWDSQGDFTTTHPLSVIKVKLFTKNTGMLAIEDKELGRANLLWSPIQNNNKAPQWYNMIVPKASNDQLRVKLSVSMERPLNMKQFGYLWSQGNAAWKKWKKRFFIIVQVSQCNFAMCSYIERRTEPVAMIQLGGYTVDYTTPDDHKKHKLFFKASKEGNNILFASDDHQVGTCWVQALYRATGQSYRPVPPPQDGGAGADKQLNGPSADADHLRPQDMDEVISVDPCKYDHASLFELLQRRTLHYRLNDAWLNMGNFTPGQVLVLDEYCARYGVRDYHRKLCLLNDLLDQADRGLMIDSNLLQENYVFCTSQILDKQPKSISGYSIVTVDEMRRYFVTKERIRTFLMRQVVCFRYCVPFGRPKGNLKAVLQFLSTFKEEDFPNIDKNKSNEINNKIKTEDKNKTKSEDNNNRVKTEDKNNRTRSVDEEKSERAKELLRLVVRECLQNAASYNYKQLIEHFQASDDPDLPASEYLKKFIYFTEEAVEILKRDKQYIYEPYEWFDQELFKHSECFIALLTVDLEKLLVKLPNGQWDCLRIFKPISAFFLGDSDAWENNAVKCKVFNLFSPVVVCYFDTTTSSIERAIESECTKKNWESPARSVVAILNRLDASMTFLHDLHWTDEVFVYTIEHDLKSIATKVLQDLIGNVLQRFMERMNSIRVSLDLVLTENIYHLVNLATLSREMLKLCRAGRDSRGVKHSYYIDVQKMVNDAIDQMKYTIVSKLDKVLETVLNKLSRYDQGSLTASLMTLSKPDLELAKTFAVFVGKNQDALQDKVTDEYLVQSTLQSWYLAGLKQIKSWLDSRSERHLHQHQLDMMVHLFIKFYKVFELQGIDNIKSDTYEAVRKRLSVEEIAAGLTSGNASRAMTMKDVEAENKEKPSTSNETPSEPIKEEPEPAKEDKIDATITKEKPTTPKDKKKIFRFKMKK